MRQPSTEREQEARPVPARTCRTSRYVPNPEVLWRRTAGSVVLLPPGGDPTELIGPAASVWDRVVTPGDEPSTDVIDLMVVEQIVDALVEMEVVVAS